MIEPNSTMPHPDQSRQDQILERILGVLACPECKAPLGLTLAEDLSIGCPVRGVVIWSRGGQIVAGGFASEEIKADWLNRSKESAKRRLGPPYPLMIRLFSPVHGRDMTPNFLNSFDLEKDLVADLGSGTSYYSDRVICVDGACYPTVHVVSDLQGLPFRDDSISGLLSIAVLEHVPDPAALVREMKRVLRPGGPVLCFVPFIQGYHASPRDYQRVTAQGLPTPSTEITLKCTTLTPLSSSTRTRTGKAFESRRCRSRIAMTNTTAGD